MFQAIYKKFLTAIDHIDYHPSQMQSNTSRTKRSTIYNVYGHYHSPTKILTPSKESFLTAFMEALYKINPSLHKKLISYEESWCFYLDIRMGYFFKCQKHK